MTWPPSFGCLSRVQELIDVTMVVVSIALAGIFGIRARRHFLAGRGWRGSIMIIGVLVSGGSATLWAVTTMLGIPPFFAGDLRFAPCERGERHAVVRLSSGDRTRLDRGI